MRSNGYGGRSSKILKQTYIQLNIQQNKFSSFDWIEPSDDDAKQ